MSAHSQFPKRFLYIHPDRWQNPPKEFCTEYNIYALGVILLKIGLWQNLASLKLNRVENAEEDVGDVAERVRRKLVKLATKHLGFLVGDRYRSIVLKCLRGLD